MEISVKLDKDFERYFNVLKEEFGEDFSTNLSRKSEKSSWLECNPLIYSKSSPYFFFNSSRNLSKSLFSFSVTSIYITPPNY